MSRIMQALGASVLMAVILGTAPPAFAANLYANGAWASMASDRPPTRVGDSLTVIIDEVSTASGTAANKARKSSHFGGSLNASSAFNGSGSLDLGSGFDGSGQTQRGDKIIAQISVVVDSILPNGDLHVTGAQALKINGEHTNIRVKGRVRAADIDGDNTVLSTRLADAVIDYDGTGFIDRNNKPGIITRALSWLGLP